MPCPGPNHASWPQVLAPYRDPSTARGLIEIAVTFLPLVALWALSWVAVH